MINVFRREPQSRVDKPVDIIHGGLTLQKRPAIGHSAYVIHTGRPHVT